MIFRQLFEPGSSTYTYLIGCRESGRAVLVDPVLERAAADLAVLEDLGLTLACTLETHVHADHVTSAAHLRSLTGCRVACPANAGVSGADTEVTELEPLDVGSVRLNAIHTPGHTASHHAYFIERDGCALVLTGDALLIDGCGRTDFQGGDSAALYRSIHSRLFTLPGETLVYPGHDYQERRVSSIAQEKARNPRLGDGRTQEEFVEIMAALKLPPPKMIDIAVPANLHCGEAAAEMAAPIPASWPST